MAMRTFAHSCSRQLLLGTGRHILALGLADQAAGIVARSIPEADQARLAAHVLKNFGMIVE